MRLHRKPRADAVCELYEELAYQSELETERDRLVPQLKEEVSDRSISRMLDAIESGTREGMKLGAAIAHVVRDRDRFSELLIDAVSRPRDAAAAFDLLASLGRRNKSLSGLVLSLPSFAAMVTVVLVVIIIMLTFVVPQFQELFASFGADLPAFTLLLLDLSEFVARWYWVIALLAIAVPVAYRQSPAIRLPIDRLFLKLPVFGKHREEVEINEFLFRFVKLRENELLPEEQALRFSRERVGNAWLKQALDTDAAHLTTLVESVPMFPARVDRILSRDRPAEQVGRDLYRYVEITGERLVARSIHHSQVLDTLLKILMFLTIGAVIVALYLPIFQMGSVI